MLHSDDADINVVIREIISLDNRAIAMKKKVAARAEQMLEQSKTETKESEKTEIEKAQLLAKKNYETEIEKAQEERQSIINSMDKELLKLRYRYDEQKEEKALELLEKLFKNSREQR